MPEVLRHRQRPFLERLEDRAVPAAFPTGFTASTVASGLVDATAVELVPDGRILVAQQAGALRIIDHGRLEAAPALQLQVDREGERGLLGVTVDPAFTDNHFIYVYYTTATAPIHNRISRFTLSGNRASAEKVLMDLEPLQAIIHNGGALHFGRDAKLYIGVGENGHGPNAQSLDTRLGKILRINADGSIPSDNPFFNITTGANRAIWALGLRNPFTFGVQPGTGRIFINDVGAQTWEEIDDGKAGANYGWPTSEGPTTDPRFRTPLFAYQHGEGNQLGRAIVGAAFYNPGRTMFPSDFAGDYFFGDLVNGWIRRYDPRTGRVAGFATGISMLVDIRAGSDGSLYYLSRGAGTLVRVQYRRPDLRWPGRGIYVTQRIRADVPFQLTRIFTVAGSGIVRSFTISFYASRDDHLGDRNDVLLGRELIRDARAGRTQRGHSPVLRIRRPGSQFLFAVLDSGGNVVESSEGNNTARTRVVL